jgi:hypothetical protein
LAVAANAASRLVCLQLEGLRFDHFRFSKSDRRTLANEIKKYFCAFPLLCVQHVLSQVDSCQQAMLLLWPASTITKLHLGAKKAEIDESLVLIFLAVSVST